MIFDDSFHFSFCNIKTKRIFHNEIQHKKIIMSVYLRGKIYKLCQSLVVIKIRDISRKWTRLNSSRKECVTLAQALANRCKVDALFVLHYEKKFRTFKFLIPSFILATLSAALFHPTSFFWSTGILLKPIMLWNIQSPIN